MRAKLYFGILALSLLLVSVDAHAQIAGISSGQHDTGSRSSTATPAPSQPQTTSQGSTSTDQQGQSTGSTSSGQ